MPSNKPESIPFSHTVQEGDTIIALNRQAHYYDNIPSKLEILAEKIKNGSFHTEMSVAQTEDGDVHTLFVDAHQILEWIEKNK